MVFAEYNGYFRILIGSFKLAVSAHAQYIFGQKQPGAMARRLAVLMMMMISFY